MSLSSISYRIICIFLAIIYLSMHEWHIKCWIYMNSLTVSNPLNFQFKCFQCYLFCRNIMRMINLCKGWIILFVSECFCSEVLFLIPLGFIGCNNGKTFLREYTIFLGLGLVGQVMHCWVTWLNWDRDPTLAIWGNNWGYQHNMDTWLEPRNIVLKGVR